MENKIIRWSRLRFGCFSPLPAPALGIRRKAFTLNRRPKVPFQLMRMSKMIIWMKRRKSKLILDPARQMFDGCQLIRKSIEDFTSYRIREKCLHLLFVIVIKSSNQIGHLHINHLYNITFDIWLNAIVLRLVLLFDICLSKHTCLKIISAV